MLVIGLTGGIASGKSTIAKLMRRHHLPVFDSDKAVHQLLGPKGAAVPLILARFGDVGDVKNGIDRALLGKMVFGDKAALSTLEGVLHPMVQEARNRMMQIARANRKRAIILDVPLLFETGGDHLCDVTMMSWAPAFLIRQRALARPNMSDEKLDQIVARQMSAHEKAKLVDEIIPTGLGHGIMTGKLNRLLVKWHLR